MPKLSNVSRRKFLGILGATGLLPADGPLAAEVATPDEPSVPFYKALKPAQVAALEAIAAQIVPADQDPGAREAGAVLYIDRILAEGQSYRLPAYAAGLAAIDQTSQAMFSHDFVDLSFDRQTAVLKAIEQGKAPSEIWKEVSSPDFFALVWNHVLEGFYGPPQHGGNKNYASWKMVGFPEHSGTM